MSSAADNKRSEAVCLIACSVFRPVLGHLEFKRRFPNVRVSFLPSNLHVSPQKLKRYLAREVAAAKRRDERVVCLYGECFPDIEEFCRKQGITKVRGFHCYEMLLGSGEFKRLIDETAGTYFLEQDLIRNFERYCAKPLELHDEEMRSYCFEHYTRMIYIRQPSDPDLREEAERLANFLGLTVEVRDADYSQLENELTELICTT
jgi:hypothetical protein